MDIDIDLKTTFDPSTYFKDAITASMVQNQQLVKHPAGVYFQNIPVDPITQLAAIPYQQAEALGYTKIDFLHLSLLNNFDNKQQIRDLLKKEPTWSLLEDADTVQKLFQLHRHYKLVNQVKPKSVQQLADSIALIRPAKRHLLAQYLQNKDQTRPLLYQKPDDGKYYFKRSHAIAYATTVTLQLHLIDQGLL